MPRKNAITLEKKESRTAWPVLLCGFYRIAISNTYTKYELHSSVRLSH